MELDVLELDELVEFFDFLDDLRESGETNMFGVGRYLIEEYDMSRALASKVLTAWMKTFDRDVSAFDRALQALDAA